MPADAASSSTSTPSSTSTTRGSGPRWSAAPTSTSGGSRRRRPARTARPSTRRCSPRRPPGGAGRRLPRGLGAAGEGLTFPISYHFEPGAADDGLTIDVPVATLNQVGADDFSWNVPGPARGAGHRADPQPAQEPAGQLRARPNKARDVPRRGAGRRGAPARRPGALRPVDDRGGGAARRVGLDQGARAPAADLPGRRRRRRRAGARQGPRGAQGAAATAVRRGAGRGRRRLRLSAPGETAWTFGDCRAATWTARRPRGGRLPGAWSTRAQRRPPGLRHRGRGEARHRSPSPDSR